jgi:hypothetical protein
VRAASSASLVNAPMPELRPVLRRRTVVRPDCHRRGCRSRFLVPSPPDAGRVGGILDFAQRERH